MMMKMTIDNFVAVAIKDNIYVILSKPCSYEVAEKFKDTPLIDEKFDIVTLEFLQTLPACSIIGAEYLHLKTRALSVERNSVNLYQIFPPVKSQWADIIVDDRDKAGRITINSCWGDWNYYWKSCDKSFKQFLIELKTKKEYFAFKMGDNNCFDFEASIVDLKKQVLLNRKNNRLDKLMARLSYNEIVHIERNCPETVEDLYRQYNATKYLIYVSCLNLITRISFEFEEFWQEAFLPFINYLEQEIKNEK